ncbi:hypothetical protein WICPIJ_000748 [Wickerhamomyces pijperi]|uniref:Alpha-1,3-mannosyltransferase n=1 Tax=Wickerhamomyces pijperi TaxID=599730 RepID=A0A9P8QC15_WICPI|nr:hypothetical protein WICPIJ_000748 [Wickerhamomyces pijperi]
MVSTHQDGGLPSTTTQAVKTFTRKNLLIIILSSFTLTLILNLHLLNFSAEFTTGPDGMISYVDHKVEDHRQKPVVQQQHHSHDKKPSAKNGPVALKNQTNPFPTDPHATKEQLQLLDSFLNEYNLSDFTITKDKQMSTPSMYERLLDNYPLQELIKMSSTQRCSLYFQSLYEADSNPVFETLNQNKNPHGWGLSSYNILPYSREAYERYVDPAKVQHQWADDEEGRELKEQNDRYGSQVIQNQRAEKWQIDALRHYLAFDKCFLSEDDKESNSDSHSKFNLTDIEHRLFPWLSFKLPQYKRWDGFTVKGQFPLMANFSSGQASPDLQPVSHAVKSSSFLLNMKNSLNGEGYVISAANHHAAQAYQLIALMRALGNKLPIQIFHYGDLDEYHQKRLVHIARTTEDLKLEGVVDNLNYVLKQKGIKKMPETKEEIEKLFPPQELWFVNAHGTLTPEYRGHFNGFGNKLIAYFFCSFKNTILMDTDTVPLVDFKKNLIESREFQGRGAYFFQDREMSETFGSGDVAVEYLHKMFPSSLDSFFLGVEPLSNHTLQTRFMTLYDHHYMESGVVLVDKRRHFLPVLTTMLVNQIDPVTSLIYGDKELFWLGFAMSGVEEYYMNKWPAGAIGSRITPLKSRIYHSEENKPGKEKFYANEVCSTHPAHLSGIDDSTVLWINSGFVRCKKYDEVNSEELSARLNPKVFDSIFELKSFYSGYQNFEHILIPGTTEYRGGFPYFENWWRMEECSGYIWCAYNNDARAESAEAVADLFELENGVTRANHTVQVPTETYYEDEENELYPQRNIEENKLGKLLSFDEGQKVYYNYLGSIYEGVLKIYNLQYA